MGFNFTERVRRILARARDEASLLHHEYVGTEHILLGIAGEDEGVAIEVLRGLGADPQALGRRLKEAVRAGSATSSSQADLPYTSRAKKTLELAMNEARALNHSFVGSEHLLLGIAAEGKGIGAQVLAEAGVTIDRARSETVRLLGTGPARIITHAGEARRGADVRTAFERVEVILHYRDGRRLESSFTTAQDAIAFLRSSPSPKPG